MATKEDLFAAVRLIKEHCKLYTDKCYIECPLGETCAEYFNEVPEKWPDPEEGGGEDG